MEDIKLGRELGSQVRDVSSLLGSGNPVCAQDPKRTRLIFSTGRNGPVVVWPNGFSGDATNGIVVSVGNRPTVLRVEDFGPLIWGTWFAADAGVGSTLMMIEATLERQQ